MLLTGFPEGAFDTDFIHQVYEFPDRHPVKKPDRQGASIFTTESIHYKWTIDRFRWFISIAPAENSDDSTFRTQYVRRNHPKCRRDRCYA